MGPPLIQFAPDALPRSYATAVDTLGRGAGVAGALAGGIGLYLTARETASRWSARDVIPFTVPFAMHQLSSASRDLNKVQRGLKQVYKPSGKSYLPGSYYTGRSTNGIVPFRPYRRLWSVPRSRFVRRPRRYRRRRRSYRKKRNFF